MHRRTDEPHYRANSRSYCVQYYRLKVNVLTVLCAVNRRMILNYFLACFHSYGVGNPFLVRSNFPRPTHSDAGAMQFRFIVAEAGVKTWVNDVVLWPFSNNYCTTVTHFLTLYSVGGCPRELCRPKCYSCALCNPKIVNI